MGKKISPALIISEAKNVLSAYDYKITLRQLYYRLVAKLIIPNTISRYTGLSRVMTQARKSREIDPNVFEDRTRSASVTSEYLRDKEDVWIEYRDWLVESMRYYSLPRWFDQPKKVIVFVEKDALSSVFNQICQPLDITLIVSRGYNSYTQLHNLARTLKNDFSDRQIHFLTFGDFDPSGKDIVRNFEDQLIDMGVRAEYEEIALTEELISLHQLPPMPTKTTDKRARAFMEQYGDISIELDALDPDILQKLITDNVEKHFDTTIHDKVIEMQDEYRTYLKEQVENFSFEDYENDQ